MATPERQRENKPLKGTGNLPVVSGASNGIEMVMIMLPVSYRLQFPPPGTFLAIGLEPNGRLASRSNPVSAVVHALYHVHCGMYVDSHSALHI